MQENNQKTNKYQSKNYQLLKFLRNIVIILCCSFITATIIFLLFSNDKIPQEIKEKNIEVKIIKES